MPTPPDILIPPCKSILGGLGVDTVYTRNQYGPYAFHHYPPFKAPKIPVWDMRWPSNQIQALFLALTPAERATWVRPAARARLPVRTFFVAINMKRCHGRPAYIANITRTYKAS